MEYIIGIKSGSPKTISEAFQKAGLMDLLKPGVGNDKTTRVDLSDDQYAVLSQQSDLHIERPVKHY